MIALAAVDGERDYDRVVAVEKVLFGDVTQGLLLELRCPVVTVRRDRYEAE
jgi:nucleotide-binding universal stress UspA family protein